MSKIHIRLLEISVLPTKCIIFPLIFLTKPALSQIHNAVVYNSIFFPRELKSQFLCGAMTPAGKKLGFLNFQWPPFQQKVWTEYKFRSLIPFKYILYSAHARNQSSADTNQELYFAHLPSCSKYSHNQYFILRSQPLCISH